jgi:hypothetical protein
MEDDIIQQAMLILDSRIKTGPLFTAPTDVKNYLCLKLAGLQHEVFVVLFLDDLPFLSVAFRVTTIITEVVIEVSNSWTSRIKEDSSSSNQSLNLSDPSFDVGNTSIDVPEPNGHQSIRL